jgi:serine protease Do
MMMDVAIGERPAERAEASQPSEKSEHAKLGVTVENVDADTARQLNLRSTSGALVTDVQSGSPADDGGVHRGDVIREINHKPVKNVTDLQAAIGNLKEGSTVLLSVVRQGETFFLAFDLS